MLLVPERDERRFEPAAHRAQPVDAGMAGGTQGNQEARVMDARTAVVDGEFTIRPTGAAAASVALQNLLAVAGEAAAGMRVRASNSESTIRSKRAGGSRRGRKAGPAGCAPRKCRAQVDGAGPAKSSVNRLGPAQA